MAPFRPETADAITEKQRSKPLDWKPNGYGLFCVGDMMIKNNRLVENGAPPPYQLVRKQVIKHGTSRLRPLAVHGGQLLVARDGYLAGLELHSMDTVWELKFDKAKWPVTVGDANALLTNFYGPMARLDRGSGAILWQTDEAERPWLLSAGAVVSVARRENSAEIFSRDVSSGAIGWSHTFSYGLTSLADAGDVLLALGDGSITALDTATGAPLWQLNVLAWCEVNYVEKIAAWKAVRNEASVELGPYFNVGPSVDGTVFASFDIGLVLAIDVASGEPRWECEIEDPTQAADRMIYRDGMLYFNGLQLRGIASHLSCVDARTGSLLYRQPDNFTPSGCANPIMMDRWFLGGYGGHLAAFDVVDQAMVWRYEHPDDGGVFHSGCLATAMGFVSADGDTDSLLWFESTAG